MTKASCIHSFWSSFGIPAYAESSVPENVRMPYITYEFASASGGEEIPLGGDIWYDDGSWVGVNEKAEEISAHIGRGGVLLDCDGGKIRIMRSSPFSLSVKEENDSTVRRKSLTISVMYLTHD